MSLIVYSFPIFFILIGLEILISKLRKQEYYRLNDAVTNLSCGIGQQVLGVFIRFMTVGVYALVYTKSPMKDKVEQTIGNPYLTGLLLFFGVDFFYYWFHRLAHEVALLWGSHVVHHQSEEYNLTVALRQAWFQGVFSWVFYIPLAFMGFSVPLFATIASLQTLYQFWIHTKMIRKLPKPFEYVFNTPSHHRVHHGVNPKYIDRNHGGTLIIFDRWFGTFQEEEEEVVYGITSQPNSWNPLWLNVNYWIDLGKHVIHSFNLKNSLLFLVKMPGWMPAELGGNAPLKEVTNSNFKKYDTSVSPAMTYYIIFQFILVLIFTTLYMNLESTLFQKMVSKVYATALVLLSIVSIGALFESKKWSKALEIIRWVSALVFFLLFLPLGDYLRLFVGMLCLVSIIWLFMVNNKMTTNDRVLSQ